ncbi:hypothetical protein [Vibrio parahaemolyticus]|uniref:hypothetical protein n=1 Tax=Vibrio parahaemolyticus TaxID=670 RepID=UPI0023607E79|nr:hypothetical protein [Vibrio parahaemolyticus]
MDSFDAKGEMIRNHAKGLVVEFMQNHPDCSPESEGMKQAEIFRLCGFGWGEQLKATLSNQQYWLVALLRQLEHEGVVVQLKESGPWRLIKK